MHAFIDMHSTFGEMNPMDINLFGPPPPPPPLAHRGDAYVYMYINNTNMCSQFNCIPFFCMFYICLCVLPHTHIGILPPPLDFKIDFLNCSVNISWKAPASLEMSTPPTIFYYVLSSNLTNGTKTFDNPTSCNPVTSCNYSYDRRDPFVTTDGNGNTTMLDYNGTVEFTLFAVNGAGNGNAATFTLDLQRGLQTG